MNVDNLLAHLLILVQLEREGGITSSRVHFIVPVSSAYPAVASNLAVGSMVMVTFVKSLNSNAPTSHFASRLTWRWSS